MLQVQVMQCCIDRLFDKLSYMLEQDILVVAYESSYPLMVCAAWNVSLLASRDTRGKSCARIQNRISLLCPSIVNKRCTLVKRRSLLRIPSWSSPSAPGLVAASRLANLHTLKGSLMPLVPPLSVQGRIPFRGQAWAHLPSAGQNLRWNRSWHSRC